MQICQNLWGAIEAYWVGSHGIPHPSGTSILLTAWTYVSGSQLDPKESHKIPLPMLLYGSFKSSSVGIGLRIYWAGSCGIPVGSHGIPHPGASILLPAWAYVWDPSWIPQDPTRYFPTGKVARYPVHFLLNNTGRIIHIIRIIQYIVRIIQNTWSNFLYYPTLQ